MKVRTLDDKIEDFSPSIIKDALLKDEQFRLILNSVDKNLSNDDLVAIVTNVTNNIRLCMGEIISSDTIRGMVVNELVKLGYNDLSNIVEIVGLRISDIYDIIQGNKDNDNANLQATPETSHKIIADTISKKYYLRMFPSDIRNAHIKGDLHIHDLEYFGTRPFCRSWDLRRFFLDGFSADGENSSIIASAPKHAEVAILQATKVLAMGQCHHSGGQGLLYGTVFLAPYMKNKSYEEIKQLMQMMFYELNQMYISRGGQVIFSSINVSPGCPKVLEDVPVVYAGKIFDGKENDLWTYKQLEQEIRLQFKAIMELSLEGDSAGKLFPFPKIEIAIEPKFINTNNINQDIISNRDGSIIAPSYNSLYKMAFEIAAKTGILYFDNMVSAKKDSENSVSCTQCCSYSFKSDKASNNDYEKELTMKEGYFFRLGGMQAVSINLPRIAYNSENNDKKFIANLYNVMDLAVKVFLLKKAYINDNIDRLKFLTQKGKNTIELTDFNKLVYEVGIVGLNEAIQYHKNMQIHEGQEAIHFGKKVLQSMSEYCKILSDMYNIKIVLARTPAETTAQRFAVLDCLNAEYKDKAIKCVKGNVFSWLNLTINMNAPIYYSNGFAPSVDANIRIVDKLNLESNLWQYVDGGAITHIWLNEDNPDANALMHFALCICKFTNIGYFAFTKNLSQCIHCNNIENGIKYKCSKCGSEDLNVKSRITGYYSDVYLIRNGKIVKTRWNAAKEQELKDRHSIKLV